MSFEVGDLVGYRGGLWKIDDVKFALSRCEYADDMRHYSEWYLKHLAGPKRWFFFRTAVARRRDLEKLNEMEVLALAASC